MAGQPKGAAVKFNYWNEHMPEPIHEGYEDLTPEGFEQNLKDYYEIYPDAREEYPDEREEPDSIDDILGKDTGGFDNA